MTRVSAAIEQISKGQIGHPAACIIESNRALSCGCPRTAVSSLRADYGVAPGLASAPDLWHASSNAQDDPEPERSSTGAVDNFVDNHHLPLAQPRIGAPWNGLLNF
ncbi:MAG: hypothetical protein ABIQ06_08105 [Caldimonas sp.]